MNLFFLLTLSLFFQEEAFKHLDFLANRHIHGYKNDFISYEGAKKILDQPKLSTTCTTISEISIRYLAEKGIKARFILLLTLEEWNTYNNGHSLIEIWNGKQWILVDIDLKNVFVKSGNLLNATELCSIEDYDVVKFSFADVLDEDAERIWANLNVDLVTPEGQKDFYHRCAQVPMIKHENNLYFTCDESHRELVLSYPYFGWAPIYLYHDEFITIFYGE